VGHVWAKLLRGFVAIILAVATAALVGAFVPASVFAHFQAINPYEALALFAALFAAVAIPAAFLIWRLTSNSWVLSASLILAGIFLLLPWLLTGPREAPAPPQSLPSGPLSHSNTENSVENSVLIDSLAVAGAVSAIGGAIKTVLEVVLKIRELSNHPDAATKQDEFVPTPRPKRRNKSKRTRWNSPTHGNRDTASRT
jgi:hypothetical protein